MITKEIRNNLANIKFEINIANKYFDDLRLKCLIMILMQRE